MPATVTDVMKALEMPASAFMAEWKKLSEEEKNWYKARVEAEGYPVSGK